MRIALFSDTYIPDINGVAVSTRILRNELVKHGHDVIVVTSELPSDSDYVEDPTENILRVPGLELQALYGYRACNIYSFKGMKELKNWGVEIVHTQTEFGIGIFSRIVGEVLNVPVVYTYHTMWADYSHYVTPVKSNAVDGLVKKVIYRISKIYGSKCTELIVPSLKTKEALEKYGIERSINIIPTGLELKRFDPQFKDNELINQLKTEYNIKNQFIVTFLGRIAKEKSIDLIIKAISKVVKINDNVLCLIVGGGPSLEELKAMVEEYNLEKYVVFTGPKTPDLVPSHYHLSNIFVSASLSETQGLTFIEAMASGIPAIARYDKNLEDVIKDGINGYFFKDEDELTMLICKLMKNDFSTLANNAYHDAMGFSSEVFYERVIEVYYKAINNKFYSYTIKKIYPIKGNSNEVVFLFDESEILLELSDSVIKKYSLEEEMVISRELFDTLKDYEQVTRAYNKALKYLTVKDYTYNQMRKKLMDNSDFDDTQLDTALSLLQEKNLINDKAFTINYLKRSIRLGLGLNKAIYNLKSYEIETNIINECVEEIDDDEEYQSAIELIDSIYVKSNNFSHKGLIKKVRDKLYFKGFTSDTIERAMADFDFEYSSDKEEEVLKREFSKLLLRYEKKLSDKELNNKLISVLLRKGYDYESIIKLIESREE